MSCHFLSAIPKDNEYRDKKRCSTRLAKKIIFYLRFWKTLNVEKNVFSMVCWYVRLLKRVLHQMSFETPFFFFFLFTLNSPQRSANIILKIQIIFLYFSFSLHFKQTFYYFYQTFENFFLSSFIFFSSFTFIPYRLIFVKYSDGEPCVKYSIVCGGLQKSERWENGCSN